LIGLARDETDGNTFSTKPTCSSNAVEELIGVVRIIVINLCIIHISTLESKFVK